MLKANIFRYITIGDIHLGHMNNKTKFILSNLRYMMAKFHTHFKNLDAIFINGDLFEQAIMANSEEYREIKKWFAELVHFCVVNKIKIRLLEGTPSHDAGQPGTIFETYRKIDGLDIKYFDSISIEYMEDFDLNIMYVPDETNLPAKKRFKIMKDVLKAKGLSKVDYIMLHGLCKHHMPVTDEDCHDELDLLSITNYFVHTNHVHTPGVFDRIITAGSFDRLRHGEEEAKGFTYGMLNLKTKECKFNFIKNDNARTFKTIKVKDNSEEELKRLYSELNLLPENSFVRVQTTVKDITAKELRKLYSFAEIKVEKPSKKDLEKEDIFIDTTSVEEILITKDNIIELLTDEIAGELSKEELKIMEEYVVNFNRF